MPTGNARMIPMKNIGRRVWESFAEELGKTQDVERMRELVMLLEEAIFNRQQELTLNADTVEQHSVEDEEEALKKALDLMLEIKVKKLGFPDIR